MRANVKVVGIGKRRTGVSGTGKNYDFVPVSLVFSDPGTKGFRAETVNMEYHDFDDYGVSPDQELDMVFHFVQGRMFVDAVL